MKKKYPTINNDFLHSFKENIKTIVEAREKWQGSLFKSANDSLYNLLGKIFDLIEETKTNTEADKEKRDWLLSECRKRKLRHNMKPSFIQLITKLVFSDSDVDSRRISSYVRVLTAAKQYKDVVVGADVPNFIRKNGGIEEIRASLCKNTKTPTQRAELGRGLALKSKILCEVTTEETLSYATKTKGNFAVALGIVNAKGVIEVKHVCYENPINNYMPSGKTAINTALSNLYSIIAKKEKNELKRVKAEQQIEEKNQRALEMNSINDKNVLKLAA
jgi:hypothetical protein